MSSLSFLENYFSKFDFKKFNSIFNLLYSSKSHQKLSERLEFSSLFDSRKNLDLRFGLFKISKEENIKRLAKERGYDPIEIEKSLSVMRGFTPEYAIGFDKDSSRFKIYFLRLPDNNNFDEKIEFKIQEIAKINGIRDIHLDKLRKEDCYLLGVDYYKSAERNLKVYTHTNTINFRDALTEIDRNGFKSYSMKEFKRFFEEKDFQDTTYSYKYTNQAKDHFKFAVFFEPQQIMNDKIEEFIKNKYPNKFIHFKTMISSIEDENNRIHYNQVGLTFSSKNSVGRLCVYYSPTIGDKRK